jgi:hypothetical protein
LPATSSGFLLIDQANRGILGLEEFSNPCHARQDS